MRLRFPDLHLLSIGLRAIRMIVLRPGGFFIEPFTFEKIWLFPGFRLLGTSDEPRVATNPSNLTLLES